MKKHYDAVIFDLDGTLIDSMWIWKTIDMEYLKKHGYTLPDDLQKSIEGMSTTETAQYFKDRFDITDAIDTIKDEWIDMAWDYYANVIEMKAGAVKYLHQLHRQGVKIGLGTSNFKNLAEVSLKKHDVLHLFSAIRTSSEVAFGKPSPDVFLKVAEDLGVSPDKCLVFEDTHAGILAAKSAGMDVIAIFDELSVPYHEEIKRDARDLLMDYEELIED